MRIAWAVTVVLAVLCLVAGWGMFLLEHGTDSSGLSAIPALLGTIAAGGLIVSMALIELVVWIYGLLKRFR